MVGFPQVIRRESAASGRPSGACAPGPGRAKTLVATVRKPILELSELKKLVK
jgi:hypothetical protein